MIGRLKRLTRASIIDTGTSVSDTCSGNTESISPEADLTGIWETRFTANERSLHIEYSFLESGSGFEKITTDASGKLVELHRYFWKLEDHVLTLTYITDKMMEVKMMCRLDGTVCTLSDRETASDEMVLHRKTV